MVRKNLQGFYCYPGSHEVLSSGLPQRCLCPVRSEVGGIWGIFIGAVERVVFFLIGVQLLHKVVFVSAAR